MAHAYTPGLKVTENFLLRKRRILPLQGDVVVKVGQHVGPDDVVAKTREKYIDAHEMLTGAQFPWK